MLINQDHKSRFRRQLTFIRIIGWFFVIIATGLILSGLIMLANSQSVVALNGVTTHAARAKLFFVLFPLIHLAIGLFMGLSPKVWVFRLFAWQEQRRQQRLEQLERFVNLLRGK